MKDKPVATSSLLDILLILNDPFASLGLESITSFLAFDVIRASVTNHNERLFAAVHRRGRQHVYMCVCVCVSSKAQSPASWSRWRI